VRSPRTCAASAPRCARRTKTRRCDKFNAYLEARQYLRGYENARIGFDFTNPGMDPPLRSAIEQAIADLRRAHPDVEIVTRFANELLVRGRRRVGIWFPALQVGEIYAGYVGVLERVLGRPAGWTMVAGDTVDIDPAVSPPSSTACWMPTRGPTIRCCTGSSPW